MKKWLKWIIVLSCILVGTVFFGSLVFTMLGFGFDLMATLMSWFASASRWVAKLIDFWGFAGMFSPNTADAIIVATNSFKMLMLGG